MHWDREELLNLAEAAKLIPGRTGRGVAVSTIWRWILHGRRGIRLESVLIGGSRYVSRESLRRFVSGINRDSAAIAAVDSDSKQQRAIEERLKANGI